MNLWHFSESVLQCVMRVRKVRGSTRFGQTTEEARAAIETSLASVLVPGVGLLPISEVYLDDLNLIVKTRKPTTGMLGMALAGMAAGGAMTVALLTIFGVIL